jgi:hypothetical protein
MEDKIMLNSFSQCCFRCFVKIFVYFAVMFTMQSCVKDDIYAVKRQYNYSNHPERSYVPNYGYYGNPYELSPKRYPYNMDYDQYYVAPYGYHMDDNIVPSDFKS